MQTHELKCWPRFFRAIESGEKTFDVRKGEDRVYRKGDWLMLREFNPDNSEGVQDLEPGYTGDIFYKQITYVMHGTMGLGPDMWALGLSR